MVREDGHYYVRYGGKWEIARWSEGYGWKTFDWIGYHKDSAFEKIDENRILHHEVSWRKGYNDLLDTALGLKEPLKP
jgi:hypothetical protein